MVSGVSILNLSALRKRFSLLRSSIGLHLMLGFGTRNSRLIFDCLLALLAFLSIR